MAPVSGKCMKMCPFSFVCYFNAHFQKNYIKTDLRKHTLLTGKIRERDDCCTTLSGSATKKGSHLAAKAEERFHLVESSVLIYEIGGGGGWSPHKNIGRALLVKTRVSLSAASSTRSGPPDTP